MSRMIQCSWDMVKDGVLSCDARSKSPLPECRMERRVVLLDPASPARETATAPGSFAGALGSHGGIKVEWCGRR